MVCRDPSDTVAKNSPSLPLEIIDMIFQDAHQSALASASRCNTLFYPLACRTLYRTVETSPKGRKCIRILKTLCAAQRPAGRSKRIPLPALFVRTVCLDLSKHYVTANLLRLVHRALSCLPNLLDLRIEFSLKDNRFHLGWVLEGCILANAQLERLSTSVRCDSILSSFLESQPKIVDLCLRGFQLNEPHTVFTLSATALPHLAGFRVVHAGMPVLGTVMKGRPVEAVGLTLFREDCYRALDTVTLSTKPVKRLTLLSLDDTDNTRPDVLLHAIAIRMPELEALHIIVLLASYTTVSLHMQR